MRNQDHIILILMSSHWLPVSFNIDFKIFRVTFKVSDLLRSSGRNLLTVQGTHLRTKWNGALAVFGIQGCGTTCLRHQRHQTSNIKIYFDWKGFLLVSSSTVKLFHISMLIYLLTLWAIFYFPSDSLCSGLSWCFVTWLGNSLLWSNVCSTALKSATQIKSTVVIVKLRVALFVTK